MELASSHLAALHRYRSAVPPARVRQRFLGLVLEQSQEALELSLLVPQAQAEMLERKAQRHGMTLGQLLRRMISSHPVCRCPEVDAEIAHILRR